MSIQIMSKQKYQADLHAPSYPHVTTAAFGFRGTGMSNDTTGRPEGLGAPPG